jgi:hypothetical protein
MKHFILAVFALFTFASAQATTITADVGSSINRTSNQFSRVSEIRVQESALGVQLINDGTVSRVETDYSLKTDYIPFVSVAVGAGVVTGSTVGHYTYSVEPKIQYALTDKIGVMGSYKFRSDADKAVKDRTQTATVSVSYEVYKDIALIAKIASVTGDIQSKQASIGAAYRF